MALPQIAAVEALAARTFAENTHRIGFGATGSRRQVEVGNRLAEVRNRFR